MFFKRKKYNYFYQKRRKNEKDTVIYNNEFSFCVFSQNIIVVGDAVDT